MSSLFPCLIHANFIRMQVLITGASGFLGEWVVKESQQRGYKIRILCRETSNLDKLKDVAYTKAIGCLSDINSLKAACMGVDLVIHLAGQIAYKKSENQAMWQTNVIGTKNLLSAMQEVGITQMIYMSSVVAIGASNKPKELNEDSPYDIGHLKLGYFDSKHEAEKLVLAAQWLKAVIINPSTIYGPGDATKSSRKIQLKVARGKFPFYTSGGVNIVHINDVIKTMFAAYDKKIFGERIIAAGENIRIERLFQIIAQSAGVKAPKIYLPNTLLFFIAYVSEVIAYLGGKAPISLDNAKTATMYHWFSNAKARRLLGIDFTSAEVAIRESVEWAKKHDYI